MKHIKQLLIGTQFLSILLGFFLIQTAYASGAKVSVAMPFSYVPPVMRDMIIKSQESDESDRVLVRRGVLVTIPNAVATVVICHGFMCDKYDAGFLRTFFPNNQFNFLTFDFRAHGDVSDGQCCTFGFHEAFDVIAAVRSLKALKECKDKPVYVYGFSMGAVAAIEAQARDSSLFDAMILDCPFDSSENILKRSIECIKLSVCGYEFSMPGRSLLCRYAFHPYVQSFVKILLKTASHMDTKKVQTYICPLSPAESVKKISIPCFFIHCKNDEKISVESIKLVFEGAAGYKWLWLTNGRRHYDSIFYNPERYSAYIGQFLTKVMQTNGVRMPIAAHIIEDEDDVIASDVSFPLSSIPLLE